MSALIAGFLTGLSLIVAIGAQNAFVLRSGLSRHYVATVVGICVAADVLLIGLGIGGVGVIVTGAPRVLSLLRWGGVLYLSDVAFGAFRNVFRRESLTPVNAVPPTKKMVVLTTLALTFLNPHVYIDTVVLLGSIGNQYGPDRWIFATGAAVSSLVWFVTLGFGAAKASPLMGRSLTWRILDGAVGAVMVLVALKLAVLRVS